MVSVTEVYRMVGSSRRANVKVPVA